MRHFDLQLATADDIPTIVSLAHTSWHQAYTGVMPPRQIAHLLLHWYSPEALAEHLKQAEYQYYIVRLSNEPVGFISMRHVLNGDYFLQRFYLDISKARGLGAAILQRVLGLYPDLKQLRLRVYRLNFKAVNFYFKMGFTIESTLDEELEGGFLLPDYVMVKKVG